MWPRYVALGALSFFACQREESKAPVFKTLNPGYARTRSQVLVREVSLPTRGRLGAAAYSANVLLWDSASEVSLPAAPGSEALAFGGFLRDFVPGIEGIPVSGADRASPLHWKPALEFLLENDFGRARSLAEAYGRVTAERFGFTGDASNSMLEFSDLFLSTRDSTAWVKLEWKPWVHPLPPGFRDGDGDGFPEAYAHVDSSLFTPALFARLAGDYATKTLSETEAIDFGRQLAAYWYPSRNTDFIDLRGEAWPDETVEAEARGELQGVKLPQALFALRGKPHGRPVYFVVAVPGLGSARPSGGAEAPEAIRSVSDNVGEYLASIQDREVSLVAKEGSGSWDRWRKKLDPFRKDVASLLQSRPAGVMAFPGTGGFLVFRRELEYLLAGDLDSLPAGKNPLRVIKALRDSLAGLGIDFLFVPIPTKQDVYPDIVSKTGSKSAGGAAQPYFRKLLLDLAKRGVETLDLLSLFQEAAKDGRDPLYQKQDTHWSTQGLEWAAKSLGERVMGYAWFGEAYAREAHYSVRDTIFSQLGDLYDRLPPESRSGFGPEKVLGRRVMDSTGKPYDDHPDAPVLVLGDSYTGVFQLTGCRHAGVTAHLAMAIGGPVDLVMGWGGGPEAPQKLRRGGPEALQGKRLVIWMMSVRDLFVYPGGW